MTPAQQPKLELITPFPPEFYAEMYRWFIQTRDNFFDDFAPRDFDGVCQVITQRSETEYTCLVTENGTPVGFIGYQDLTPHVGTLRGVCFDKAVHGNGTAKRALRQVLQQQFDRGIHKINAFPFADNARSIGFYYKLGAKYEGLLREHTLRNGKLTDMLCLAFFAKNDGYPSQIGYPNFI